MQLKIFLSVYFFMMVSSSMVGQNIESFVKNSVFYAPGTGSYVETDILITAPSVKFAAKENGYYQGAIEVTLIFSKNNQVEAFEKYILYSNEIADTQQLNLSIIDKKRFILSEGFYTFDAKFKDLNLDQKEYSYTESVIVDLAEDRMSISDISLIDSYSKSDETNLFTKSGLYMVPYVINYYPENITKLSFYSELYNSNKNVESDQVLAVYSIKKMREDVVMGGLSKYKKISTQEVCVMMSEFDITRLPTGNYNLTIEVKDQKNKLLSVKKLFFQRLNIVEATSFEDLTELYVENSFVESMSVDLVSYNLRSLDPIANASESKWIKNLVEGGNHVQMQRFLLNFWLTRNESNPRSKWETYELEVQKVNNQYTTNLEYGFETDRGRIYLQHGPPTSIFEAPREPGALPYEIWQYNRFDDGQINIKYVYYNPDLVTNDYILIHSTALGEVKNEQWESLVYDSFTGGPGPNQGTEIRKHYGSKSTGFFEE